MKETKGRRQGAGKNIAKGVIARPLPDAAHLDPEILLVDEVLAAGDLEFQKKCLGRLRKPLQRSRECW